MVTSPPASPARPGAEATDSTSRTIMLGPKLSNRVTGALISYLETVATTLNRRGVAVAGVETTDDLGLFGGRIQLARQGPSNLDRVPVELRWTETTGWEVALCPTSADPVSPWRFLHANLVPHPEHVASFTAGLLRGEDLGMRYPANFRTAGGDLTAVASQLARASSTTTRRPLISVDKR